MRRARHPRPRLLCVMQLPPPIHGVTVVNETIANSAVLAARFDIELLPLAFASSFEDLGRPSVRKLGQLVLTCARLAHVLVARRPHAVYFTLAPAGAAFYRDCVLVALLKLARVRRVYHLHGKLRPRRLYPWAFRDAWVLHLSERFVAELAGLVPRERVLVVPNGVAVSTAPVRRKPRARPRLLYLSNLTERKGPLVLLEALGRLHASGIAFEATLAGAVHDAAFLAKCRQAIRRHRLDEVVHYIGPVYGEHKHRVLAEHDIFVLPTCHDTFPLVVLEAMQAGIPVVASDEGALSEIVEHGETGLLAPAGDPAALSRCLAALVTDHELQHRMGARGRARCLERYTHAAFEQALTSALTTCTEAS